MDKNSYSSYRIEQFFAVFRQAGYSIPGNATILDFGCGDGGIVSYLRKKGYQAFGCDIQFKEMPYTALLKKEGLIRLIDLGDYRLPFEDNSFDFIISDQVFEHVQNYDVSISETKRVLKSGGACLHFFPSRYRIIEPHIKVPFATIFPVYSWLKLWAMMGVRKSSQKGMNYKRVTDDNYFYMNHRTNYLERRTLRDFFGKHFEEVHFCEDKFLNSTRLVKNNKWLKTITSTKLPSYAYSTFKGRVVLTKKA